MSAVRANTITDEAAFDEQRAAAREDPGRFHGDIAKRTLHWFDSDLEAWITCGQDGRWSGWSAVTGQPVDDPGYEAGHEPWNRAFDDDEPPFFHWFAGGLTNACFNEVDRHVLAGHGGEAAFIVEGDRWDEQAQAPVTGYPVSRARLLLETVKAGLALRSLGLAKGDRVALNLPNIIQQIHWTEAAKRLGIIYTPVFGGFSAKTLSDRIHDAGARVVITADGGWRKGSVVPFKETFTDPALDDHVPRETAEQLLAKALADLEVAEPAADRVREAVAAALAGEITVERSDVMDGLDAAFSEDEGGPALDRGEQPRVRDAVQRALDDAPPRVEAVVVIRHTHNDTPWRDERDRWAEDLLADASRTLLDAAGVASEEELLDLPAAELWRVLNEACPVEPVDAEWPMFVIYTSGSTGKPKGVVHTHGGYVAGVAHTMAVSFDVVPGDDIIYVIADPGWITGQSYLICAALATRTTSVLAEAGPLYPSAGRFASILARSGATVFKAGVTFLKSVMADPDNRAEVEGNDLSRVRVATFCAEPTSPAVQEFGMDVVTPRYINSYWATEHGGIVWTHFYGNDDFPLRADAHAYPLPWIAGDVWVDDDADDEGRAVHRRADDGERGEIVITAPYPYLARTIWGDIDGLGRPGWRGDGQRWIDTYWNRWPDQWAYTQGDFAVRYDDGSFSFHGRSDDVINVSGHRLGTEEIEGAILRDKARSADSPVGNVVVVGAPHPQKGLTPVAFVDTVDGRELSDDDRQRLSQLVREDKGAVAVPSDYLQVPALPETRSGKYMRRLLAALLTGDELGDTSTLSNPEVVDAIQAQTESWRKRTQEE